MFRFSLFNQFSKALLCSYFIVWYWVEIDENIFTVYFFILYKPETQSNVKQSSSVVKWCSHHQLLRHLCLKELFTMDFSTSRSPMWDGPRKWNMSMLLRVGWALHKRLHPKRRERKQSVWGLVSGLVARSHTHSQQTAWKTDISLTSAC